MGRNTPQGPGQAPRRAGQGWHLQVGRPQGHGLGCQILPHVTLRSPASLAPQPRPPQESSLRKEVLFKYKQLHSKGRRKNMQGPGDGPYTSTAQGQSVGTWGRDPPVLLGHRVMEPPQCLAPSAKRERQALGKEGYTEVLRVGRFPQTAPSPGQGPRSPRRVGSGSQGVKAKVTLTSARTGPTCHYTSSRNPQPVPPPVLWCSRLHLHGEWSLTAVTHHCASKLL